QWLPFLDFLKNSHRPGLSDDVYSLHLKNFLSLLGPTLLGMPGTAGYRGDYPDFIFNNFYLGLAPLGLWLLGWRAKIGKGEAFWKWSGLAVLIWTAGAHSPLGLLLPAKFFGILDPAKAAFLFVFCAFAFLGSWLQPRLDGLARHKPFPRWVSLLALLWLLEAWLSPWRVLLVIPDPYRDAGMIKAAELVRQDLGEGRMVSLHRDDLPASDPSAGPGRSILDRFLGLPPNSNAVWGIRSAGGYFSVFPDGYQDLLAYLNRGYPYEGRVLDAAGVDLILLQDRLSPFKYRALADWGPYVLNHNAGALAPLWLADEVREFPDRASVFAQLTRPDAFLEHELDTEKSPDGGAVRLLPPGRSLNVAAPGLLERWMGFWQRRESSSLDAQALSPCRISAQVNLRDPGFVVFSQTFSPGWRAWVDGKPGILFRADGLFMGLVVDRAGLHQVDLRYEPAAFRLGLFLSLIFVTFLALGLAGRFLNLR
ncbi:MAG TPA: hypothetical protein VMU88_02545, partial [bacterium]|nr:hypothetical protein [bacterium]